MDLLYTQRKATPKKQLIYHFDRLIRSRLLTVLNGMVSGSFPDFLKYLGFELMKTYGYMAKSTFEAARVSEDPVINHFFQCEHEQVLDFIELFYRQDRYIGGQEGIDSINNVLQESGIGYRFSKFLEKKYKGFLWRTRIQYIGFPEAYRITDEQIHKMVVKPTLQFLSGEEFTVTYDELVKALAACRQNEIENAITLAGAAYESFLKTVLKLKNYRFDPDRDTCSHLVKRIIENDIVPSFYETLLISPATIRNRLGDAHGRGPDKQHEANTDQAEHMINLVSSNILFLRKMIKL